MRIRRVLRRLADLSVVLVAVGLLVLLWFGTVAGVDRAQKRAEQRRIEDWGLVADALAQPVREWFEAGRSEASGLATSGDIDSYLNGPREFGTSAVVIQGSTVAASSPDLFAIRGRSPSACTIDSETDNLFFELVEAARGGGPVVSPILLVPGECQTPTVAVAAGGPRGVAVVMASAFEAAHPVPLGRIAEGEDRSGGVRLFVIDRVGRAVVRTGGPETATVRDTLPERIPRFISGVTEVDRSQRYEDGRGVGAYADVAEGWSLILEQDAPVFDRTSALGPAEEPRYVIGAILVGTFAVVFLLVAFFEVRRRRAHRRAEVAKNAFFSVAGHELRTPMTSIKGFLETLNARWDDATDEQKKMLFERMLPQARRLDRLVERLLVAASIQSETHAHPQVAPMGIEQILQGVADTYEQEAPLHRFIVKVQRNLPYVEAEAKALEQVLGHLVDNAVKYSPSGGKIGIGARKAKRGVEIIVEDEGVGLPSDPSRIFEPLEQGEDVTKRVHDEGGMGLGLFIVRTLVREMGGSVRAEGRTSQGARFVVTLKSAPTPANAPVAAPN